MKRIWTAWTEFLLRPVDVASLVFIRIAFGLVILWEVTRYFNYGWIETYWIEPEFHFTYFGFSWVGPWAGDGMYWHFVGMGILAVMIIFGICYRIASVLLFFAFTYVFLLEQARYLNHFYLVCLVSFIFCCVPANAAGSFDARFRLCQPRSTVPFWCLGLLQFQMGLVYFFGGIAKLNADWLAGEPLRMWLQNRRDYPLVGSWFESEWVVMGMIYGGLLFDLLIVPLLLWSRTRAVGFAGVILFNMMNAVLFSIGIFPWFAIAMSTLFFDPSWPRRYFVFRSIPDGAFSPIARWRVTGIGVFVALYVAWQIVLPLRHWLYPGNVSWTEEGHLYAWHMKLRSKSGKARFIVKNEDTGHESIVTASEFVESWQARRMATKPDMMLQFAHFLGDRLRQDGVTNVTVRVVSEVRLNGREPQLLVDPTVDLLEQPVSLWAKDWLIPLEKSLPER